MPHCLLGILDYRVLAIAQEAVLDERAVGRRAVAKRFSIATFFISMQDSQPRGAVCFVSGHAGISPAVVLLRVSRVSQLTWLSLQFAKLGAEVHVPSTTNKGFEFAAHDPQFSGSL